MKEDRPIYDRLVDKERNPALLLLIVAASLAGVFLGGVIAYRSYRNSNTGDSLTVSQSPASNLQREAIEPATPAPSEKGSSSSPATQTNSVKAKPNRHRAVQEPQTGTVPKPTMGIPKSDEIPLKSDNPSAPATKQDSPSTPIPTPVPEPLPQERPAVPAPVSLPVTPEKPVYRGPMSGVANWTGKLDKNGTLTITTGTPSIGILTGAALPGVPIHLSIDQTNLGIAEMPSANNSYRRLVLRSHGKHDRITIRWTVNQ